MNLKIKLYLDEYNNWNFYRLNDSLEDYHNIIVSDFFIYNLLTSNSTESPRKYKRRKHFHPTGKQVDASKHKWFYSDDNYYYLHGAIDDITGTVTYYFFALQRSIFVYQMVMKQTMENIVYLNTYTDYKTVFKSNKRELTLEEELDGKQIKNTRFTNMLEHIRTDIISTINPRAKNRIGRLMYLHQNITLNSSFILIITKINLYMSRKK